MNSWKTGDQIVYIPNHAGGNNNHEDCQTGFIMSIIDDVAFCRYWKKDLSELRTQSNSEATPILMLEKKASKPQAVVDKIIKHIMKGE